LPLLVAGVDKSAADKKALGELHSRVAGSASNFGRCFYDRGGTFLTSPESRSELLRQINAALDILPLIGSSIPELEASLMRTFAKFLADESGATAIEYGLIAAGISLAIIAVVNGLGTTLSGKFTSINNSLK
jgi:pilus assembly protein Flp/PilA